MNWISLKFDETFVTFLKSKSEVKIGRTMVSSTFEKEKKENGDKYI